jgi:hypothetical protein
MWGKIALLLALFLIVLTVAVDAKKASKHRKVVVEEEDNSIEDELPKRTDPCTQHRCGHGKECVVDPETNGPKCQCVSECAKNTDERRRVCSNANTTWQSDCDLHRHRCLCLEGLSSDCTEDHKHLHIDYYGECQELPKCAPEILEDFPRRMREWLYTIMTTRVPKPTEDANGDLAGKWVDAVIWKFCDLDSHPTDRTVSRHELFPLRAPLLSLEPCIADFLNNCDADTDHKITLIEWGQCLGAPENELEDKCVQFKALFNKPQPE